MATITIPASASEKFPVGTTIGLYPQPTRIYGLPPQGAPTATGVMTATGVAIAGVAADTPYIAYAFVNSEHRYMQVRNSSHDAGTAVGTGTTTSGSKIITGLSATSGAFAVGQRISTAAAGTAIPAGARIDALSTLAAGGVTAAAATDLLTRAGHGLKVGDPVVFSALTGGAGITAGQAYHVVSVPDANTFKVSATRGGASIDVTSDLTAGTVTGVALLDVNAGASGAQNLVAEGASPAQTELGGTLVPRKGRWQARVAQRRALAGTN